MSAPGAPRRSSCGKTRPAIQRDEAAEASLCKLSGEARRRWNVNEEGAGGQIFRYQPGWSKDIFQESLKVNCCQLCVVYFSQFTLDSSWKCAYLVAFDLHFQTFHFKIICCLSQQVECAAAGCKRAHLSVSVCLPSHLFDAESLS